MWRLLCAAGLAALLACVCLASGCATITGSENQVIMVQTLEASGGAVSGADCKLSNNNGTWSLKTPATVSVRKSADDLVVRCELEDRPAGTTRAVSTVNAGMVGNVIFGGVIGAVVDHSRGTAYDYPSVVHVVFGAHRVVQESDVALPAPAPVQSPTDGPAKMDDLDGLLGSGSSQRRPP